MRRRWAIIIGGLLAVVVGAAWLWPFNLWVAVGLGGLAGGIGVIYMALAALDPPER